VLLSAGTPMHFFEPAACNPDAFFRAEFVQRPR